MLQICVHHFLIITLVCPIIYSQKTTTPIQPTTTTTTQDCTPPPLPNHNWSFLNFKQDSILSNGYNLTVAGRPTSSAEGIHLENENQFISISNLTGTCLTDPTLCEKDGFAFNLAIKVTGLVEGGIIFTSGGDQPDKPGIALIYRFGLVQIVVRTTHKSWYLSVKPEEMNWKDKFSNIYISWSLNLKLQLRVNQILVAETVTPLPHTISSTVVDRLIIGGSSVQCIIANIQIWLVHILELINSNIVPCPSPITTTLAPTTTTTSTARPPTTTPCPEFAFSVSLTTTVNTNGQGQLSCSLSTAPPSGVSILFYWYVNGLRVNVNKTVEAPEQSASILASETGLDLLNVRITCSAEVKYTSLAEWCNYQTSNIVQPAIMCPPSSPIKVTEGAGHYLLHLKVSVPPTLLCKPQDSSQCRVEVVTQILGNYQDLKCTQTQAIPQVVLGVGAIGEGNNKQCGVVITNTNWLLGITIPIKATIDGINDANHRRTLRISVRIVGLVSSQTQEVYCNDIDITTDNMDKPNTCSSVNDPHITTYDNRPYDNMLAGEFILHRHKTLPYEVSVLYSHCSNTNPRVGLTCNCGAAVRSGDDVITFKTCDARQNEPQYGGGNSVINVEVFKNGVFTKGTKIRRFGTGQKYEVTLPIGTKVTIVSSYKPFMDISVTGSAGDRSQTEGLCGDYDGIASNDFNGLPEAAFNQRWRRPSTMFNGVAASGNSTLDVYCSCITGQTANCEEGLDVFTCTTTETNPADVTDSLVQQAKLPIIGQTQTRSRRTPRQANIDDNRIKNYTEAEAYGNCSVGLENSSTVQNCQEQFANASVNVTGSIASCVKDLMETGNIAWIAPHIRDLTEKCLTIARQDENAWDGNSTDGEPSLPAALVKSLCLQDCGTNGTCINGICVCHSGYSGERCEFSKDTVPLVLPADGLCDVISSSCANVLIDGLYFHQSSSLICHIKYVFVTDILTLTGEQESVPANYISFSQISCPVQRNAFITVSNDNIKSSNSSHLHIITKSSCQSCELSANGASAKCQWKPFSCVINGQCYARNEVHSTDNCFKCNPDISTNAWTAIAEPRCQATMQPIINTSSSTDNTAVIVLGVITGILFLMVATVAVYIIRKKSLKNKSLSLMGDDDTRIDFTRARTIQTDI